MLPSQGHSHIPRDRGAHGGGDYSAGSNHDEDQVHLSLCALLGVRPFALQPFPLICDFSPRAPGGPRVFAPPRLWPLDIMMPRFVILFIAGWKTLAAISFASRSQRKCPSKPRSERCLCPPRLPCVTQVKVFRREVSTVVSYARVRSSRQWCRRPGVQIRTGPRLYEGEASTLHSPAWYLFPRTPPLLYVRTGRSSLMLTSQRIELDFVVGVVIASVSLSVYLFPLTQESPVALYRLTPLPLYSATRMTYGSVNADTVKLQLLNRRSALSRRGFQFRHW